MKKIYIIALLGFFLLTGCKSNEEKEEIKKQQNIIGKWNTTYEIGAIGKVKESYLFKKNGKCIRILNAGNDIIDECTYDLKDNQIKIIWNNKLDKKSYSKYVEIDEKQIQIGDHIYKKEGK